MKYLLRLIALRFFMVVTLLGLLHYWIKYNWNFLLYGGEAITYSKNNTRKTVSDVYDLVKTKLDDPINPNR